MELSVIILAGGRSSRFWPLEEKNLLNFFGVPLIVYQLRRYTHFFKQKGIKPKFIVITNNDNHQLVRNALVSTEGLSFKLIIQSLANQYGAVLAGLKEVSLQNPVLVLNSNGIFTEKLIDQMIRRMGMDKIVFCGTPVKEYFPGGYLVVNNQSQQVTKIWEYPPEVEVPANLSIYKHVFDYFPQPNALLQAMLKTQQNLSYEDSINNLLATTAAEYTLNNEQFVSLKYPWHVLDAVQLFFNNIKESTIKTSDIDSTAQILGPVYIEDGVKIGSFSKIIGPTYIGKNTTIADYTLVRESHIGEECVIGGFSEVARSYLDNNVKLHRNYVGDSILASGVRLGANTVTANRRFDQENISSPIKHKKTSTHKRKLGAIIGSHTSTGVAVSFMPGVKIGKKVVVMANTTVTKDVRND
ncbi:MAG: sugar phosphate nucleotidyltransferase [Patescibacteria group bacterium]|jgi:bifunctional UDP-N-acetylglucosamine pyrophosphorylase/glucosamine-1-phosphate N-acetyltransferase